MTVRRSLTAITIAVIMLIAAVFVVIDAQSSTGGARKATCFAAPNTLRIKQDEKIPRYFEDLSIEISAAKNEYDAGQFIIFANKNIQSFDVGITTLKNADEEIFNPENIEIFAQHYIYVPKTLQMNESAFSSGYYPDALIPMANYVLSKENKISKGNNQGIWVRAFVSPQTEAGLYSGSLIVNTDNEITYIPVSIEVFDFDIGAETHSMSAFNLWSSSSWYVDQLATAHLYTSEELYAKYYDFMVDYRLMPMDIPSLNLNNYRQYALDLYQYAVREDVSSYTIPTLDIFSVKGGNGVSVINPAELEALMREILIVSTENNFDMFKKMYLYVPYHDEPSQPWQYEALRESSDSFENIKKKLAEEFEDILTQMGSDGTAIKDSLLNVPNIITIMSDGIMKSLIGYVDTWCPGLQMFMDSYSMITLNEREQAGDGIWWYTCVSPANPLPNYHIHDNMIAARLMGWMQKDYGIGGNLYWASNLFGYVYTNTGTSNTVPRDVWTDPLAWPDAAGDGYLMYPGYKYNIDGPIGTLRLESIRDGLEDYEYLYVLEKELKNACEEYGITLRLSDYIRDLYDRLYSKVKPIVDQNELPRIRREIADLILALKNNDFNALVTIDGADPVTQNIGISVFTRPGVAVTVNGNALSSGITSNNGVMYKTAVPLSSVENNVTVKLSEGGNEFTLKRNLGGKIALFENFENSTGVNKLTLGNNVTAQIVSGLNAVSGQKSLNVNVTKTEIITSKYLRFRAANGYDYSMFPHAAYIEFDVINNSEEAAVLSFDTSSAASVTSCYVLPGERKHVKVNISDLKEDAKKDLTYFQISFGNGDYSLTFDNFAVRYRQY